ncbi:spore coat protein [Bacillus alkalicellulosilyticus]|uniref:spore coat protein n=1 Tax=Alkalihalobacterium alkalicellulosilyticum TaxID=1912214 RepID=UPI000996A221|nr:spore coat protein [Bacillus alkalicellulosilyticus]
MQQNIAAHEFLETQEALRSKAAQVEMYGALMGMVQDQQLKNILQNQQARTQQSFQQGLSLLQGQGVNTMNIPMPQMHVEYQPTVGIQPSQMKMAMPNPNASQMSEMTICTLVLNQHKMGSAVAMLWAGECVNPQIRSFHVQGANTCQEMAYEIWQYMNHRGYYQAPQFPEQTMNTMMQMYSPMSTHQMIPTNSQPNTLHTM